LSDTLDLNNALQGNSQLFDSLEDIKKISENIWRTPYLPWFTKHDCEHSREIIHILGQILNPIKKTPNYLNEYEIYILLSAAFLHDIGMQFLKIKGIAIDKLTEREYEIIRKKHAEMSYRMILKKTKSVTRDDFHLPSVMSG